MPHKRLQSLIVCLLLLAGCLPPASDVTPPDPDVRPIDPVVPAGTTAMEFVLKSYQSELRSLFLDVAKKLETGELTTEIETNNYIQQKSKLIREQAFQILNQDASRIGGQSWSPSIAADYWKKQGESL